jgi:hypothetical protein
MSSESEAATDEVVESKSSVDESDESEEELWEPDKEHRLDGNVNCRLASDIFKNIVAMSLDNVVYR